MPELPEVETVVRGLKTATAGLTIHNVSVLDPKLDHLLRDESPRGARIEDVRRHGKFLALMLNGDRVLLMHMMNKESCFPSHKKIAEEAGLKTTRQVINILNRLEKSGYLQIKRRGGRSNIYTPLMR